MKTLELKQEKIPLYRPRYKVRLNETQLKAYHLLIYGLKALSQEELDNTHEEDKRTIIYNNDRAWKIIQKLKQEKLNNLVFEILHEVFPDLNGNAAPILTTPLTDNNFQVNQNLKVCNVSQDEIIRGLMKHKLLPNNFLNY